MSYRSQVQYFLVVCLVAADLRDQYGVQWCVLVFIAWVLFSSILHTYVGLGTYFGGSHKESSLMALSILVHIGLQHVQLLICTGLMRLQGNSKVEANRERPNCTVCDLVNGHCQPDKINIIRHYPMKYQDLNKDHIIPG